MKNNTAFKMAVCGCLAAFALVSAASAAFLSRAPAESGYVLREHEGYIAVYSAVKKRGMLTLTDIRVDSLPTADRLELKNGIFAGDNEQLLLLLEDLGS